MKKAIYGNKNNPMDLGMLLMAWKEVLIVGAGVLLGSIKMVF